MHESPERALCSATLWQLALLDTLLAQMPKTTYAAPLTVLMEASIGGHVRHCLEFYQCLLAGLPSGHVNYDARPRDLRLEQSPAAARAVIDILQGLISDLPLERTLWIAADLSLPSQMASSAPSPIQSSVARELLYGFDHLLHHLALVRIGLVSAYPTIPFAAELGIAPSTLRHRSVTA